MHLRAGVVADRRVQLSLGPVLQLTAEVALGLLGHEEQDARRAVDHAALLRPVLDDVHVAVPVGVEDGEASARRVVGRERDRQQAELRQLALRARQHLRRQVQEGLGQDAASFDDADDTGLADDVEPVRLARSDRDVDGTVEPRRRPRRRAAPYRQRSLPSAPRPRCPRRPPPRAAPPGRGPHMPGMAVEPTCPGGRGSSLGARQRVVPRAQRFSSASQAFRKQVGIPSLVKTSDRKRGARCLVPGRLTL